MAQEVREHGAEPGLRTQADHAGKRPAEEAGRRA